MIKLLLRLRLSTRLQLAFGLVVLVATLANGFALVQMSLLRSNLDTIVNDNNAKVSLSQTLAESVHITSRVVRTIALLTDEKLRSEQALRINAARGRYAEARKSLAIILAMLVYAGDTEPGERALAPFRGIAPPIADMVRPMSYPEMYMPEEQGLHPTAASRTMFVDEVDASVASTILDHLGASDAPMRAAQLRVLGGAMARVPVDATAFAHRRSAIMVNVAALYERPEDAPAHEAWVARFADTLRQSDTGAYVNFLGTDGADRIREAYPGTTWDRLRAIKARYDPSNLFRLNQNSPPADG